MKNVTTHLQLGVGAHAYNPSTWEAEAVRAQGQFHSETLSQRNKQNQTHPPPNSYLLPQNKIICSLLLRTGLLLRRVSF